MRLIFVGTSGFAVPSLRGLVGAGHDVAMVVTQPDRLGNRGRLTPPAVKVAALELGLPILQPERIRAPEAVEALAQAGAELIALAAYGQIIPRSVLELTPRGVVNVHGSVLPRWRGAAPVAHAILAGDETTGVTIMQMDAQLDHGPILATASTAIGPRETAAELTDRLAVIGSDLLVETVARLDEIEPREQDHGAATLAPKLSREDGELDWGLSAEDIDRRVRAFHPWPGVTLPLEGRRVKVLSGRALDGEGEPGVVLHAGRDGVEVACEKGSFLLEEVQVPGGRPGPARSLVGHHAQQR
ncbi:MAG TPA: methionyl-tRNA formyltransferase [Candidatus Dormibacteraeota bacterium]|jgi:methionyl-tRNA formyltransferase|nr:methionyl-tRNA formyltransferase [Candidatus Dormibacteraeota bacterium]